MNMPSECDITQILLHTGLAAAIAPCVALGIEFVLAKLAHRGALHGYKARIAEGVVAGGIEGTLVAIATCAVHIWAE
jgi:hypothetical protein